MSFFSGGGCNWLVSRVVTVINLQKLPSTKIQYSYSVVRRQKVKQTQDSRWNINLHFILHGWAYILMTTWAFHFMIGVDKNISTISTNTSMIWILKPLKQYDPNYIFCLIKEIIGSDLYESAAGLAGWAWRGTMQLRGWCVAAAAEQLTINHSLAGLIVSHHQQQQLQKQHSTTSSDLLQSKALLWCQYCLENLSVGQG